MSRIIRFEHSRPDTVSALGLNFNAVSEVLIGPAGSTHKAIMPCPDWASDRIYREYKACDVTFRGVSAPVMTLPNPVTGVLTECTATFICPERRNLTIICKAFGQNEFVLVFSGITGRVNHLVIPSLDAVIYASDEDLCQIVLDYIRANIDASSACVVHQNKRRGRVAILNMVTNLAHQAMNYMSGLQRLLDDGSAEMLDQVWICGAEFFGPTEDLFPEFAGKIERMQWQGISDRLYHTGLEAFKVQSNIVTKELRARILATSRRKYPHAGINSSRYPILVVTIRSQGRRCLNLPDVTREIVSGLLPHFPNLGIVVDGWVFPETRIITKSNLVTALSPSYIGPMREEATLCTKVVENLPPNVLVANLVGMTALESIAYLRNANAYLSHIGTLQHKLSWFTQAKGVVHGPSAELSRSEVGPYSSELGFPHGTIEQQDVEDVATENARGAGFYDYKIIDVTGATRKLKEILFESEETRAKDSGSPLRDL